jgi:hypothetical protein
MIGNLLLLTTAIFLALAFFLMEECRFLIPYRHLLWVEYSGPIAAFAGVLFVDLFAGFYMLSRKLFLKDMGRKLAHLEKQLRTGSSLSEELSERLKE